jgi:hypothetical protein
MSVAITETLAVIPLSFSWSSDKADRKQKVQKIVQKRARKKAQLETRGLMLTISLIWMCRNLPRILV